MEGSSEGRFPELTTKAVSKRSLYCTLGSGPLVSPTPLLHP